MHLYGEFASELLCETYPRFHSTGHALVIKAIFLYCCPDSSTNAGQMGQVT